MGLAASRQEAFWEACGFGHVDRVKKFLEQGDIDVNWVSYVNDCSPIHVASQGKPEIVQLLLEHKCDVNVKDNRGNLAIHHAAMTGHADIVQTLLDAGSEINAQEKNGWTALHNAAYWCQPKVVQLLINRGCDVNIQNKDERTALHEVARSQSTSDDKLGNIAKMLIDAGSDINAKSSDLGEADLTGLMYAAYHNHPEVAQAFVDAGCELDAVGSTFWTALHWAADRGHDEIVYILVDAGANPLKTNMRGETAAEKAQSAEIKDVLINASNMYRELHYMKRPLITQLPAPIVKPVEPYVPKCDANFKSESFLPKNWKPSTNLEKLKELRERLREQHLRSIKNATAVKTAFQDSLREFDKPKQTDTKLRESSVDPDSREVSTDTGSASADSDTDSVDELTEEIPEQNEDKCSSVKEPAHNRKAISVSIKDSDIEPQVENQEKGNNNDLRSLGQNSSNVERTIKETGDEMNDRSIENRNEGSVKESGDTFEIYCEAENEKSETETQSFLTCETDNDDSLADSEMNILVHDELDNEIQKKMGNTVTLSNESKESVAHIETSETPSKV